MGGLLTTAEDSVEGNAALSTNTTPDCSTTEGHTRHRRRRRRRAGFTGFYEEMVKIHGGLIDLFFWAGVNGSDAGSAFDGRGGEHNGFAARLFDLVDRRLRERMGSDGELLGELAVAEDLDAIDLAAQQLGAAKRLFVDVGS